MVNKRKPLNVAIVGGGPGCKAIMDMIFAERLSQLRMELIGVACTNPNAVGYLYAKAKGIYTTRDHTDLYKLKDLGMIIELTGRDEVAKEISRTKPDSVRLIDHVAARLFWDIFQIEEESISSSKRAEEAMRQSEEEKRTILDASVDSICLLDKDMTIRWANRTMSSVLDAPLEDILGQSCYRILANRDTPCEGCPSKTAFESGEVEHAMMCRHNQAGTKGESYWDCYGIPLKNELGETHRVIHIARDVTAQIEAEKELRRRHHALEAINSILFRVTKEYNLNGMGEVLSDIMEEFYPGACTLIFLLAPRRESFYFPRPERRRVKETCYDRAKKKIKNPKLEHDLLKLLTTEQIRPASFGSKAHYPAILQDLGTGFTSWMIVPVEVEDVCYGLFMAGSPSKDTWLEGDLVFVESLVRQISGVIRYQISKEAREDAFRNQLAGPDKFVGIVGRSQAMHEIYRLVEAVADSESTVLITGESGTGKELVARAIHQAGRYKGTPFIAAHCSSFVPSLVQSELFGHEKGAFTGATSRKLGRLERAHGGVLFLDEVAELPLETQVLLLRFLQDKSFERVGGQRPVKVNVRIIAATNRRVEEEVKARRLRKDFYYRLNVIPLHVPSLKEHITDVPLLADHFLKTYCLIEGKEITGFDTKAMQLMMEYDWPGNVRELQNTVARCVVLATTGLIGIDELPEPMRTLPATPKGYSLPKNERKLIVSVMRDCNWNKKEAAHLLEISRSTLYSKLKKHNIQP